jgi:hypothetical protein
MGRHDNGPCLFQTRFNLYIQNMPCSTSRFASIIGRSAAVSALALMILSPSTLAAEGTAAAQIIGPAAYAEIQAKGKAVRTGTSSLALLPAHASAEGLRAAVAAEKPGVIVETVFALPRKGPPDLTGRKAELASIYGLMRSFGTLKGIEYYSASHKAMRVLYAESYRIDDEVKRSPLPDPPAPAADSIPATETMLAFQKDLSLGANVYRYSFATFPDAVLVEATNLTIMSYGIVPMVSTGGFKTRILVIAADDAIVFYSASTANPPGIFRSRIGESLANRAEALFRWFSAKSSSFPAQK